MIHEILPHRFSNLYHAKIINGENDLIFHFKGDSLLLKNDGEIPEKRDLPGISDTTQSTFLFTIDDVPCFLIWDEIKLIDQVCMFRDISFFRTARQDVAWISLVAYHLKNWYSLNRFCGKCGAATHHKHDERALVCPACHTIVYPKISPAIIVAITCKDKILLVRNAKFSRYSLIAGFSDIGESLEETVSREAMEEAGIHVRNIRYYKSQPWPLSGSLMTGFIAEADETEPLSADGSEITEAAWFSRGNLPEYSPSFISIGGEMIERFDKGSL